MISIIRSGDNFGNKIHDIAKEEFSEDPTVARIRKVIVVKKIDPEEFEDQGVDEMEKELTPEEQEELEGIDKEVPPEVDEIPEEDFDEDEDLQGSDEDLDEEDDLTISDEDLDEEDLEEEDPEEEDPEDPEEEDLDESVISKIEDYI